MCVRVVCVFVWGVREKRVCELGRAWKRMQVLVAPSSSQACTAALPAITRWLRRQVLTACCRLREIGALLRVHKRLAGALIYFVCLLASEVSECAM